MKKKGKKSKKKKMESIFLLFFIYTERSFDNSIPYMRVPMNVCPCLMNFCMFLQWSKLQTVTQTEQYKSQCYKSDQTFPTEVNHKHESISVLSPEDDFFFFWKRHDIVFMCVLSICGHEGCKPFPYNIVIYSVITCGCIYS